MTDKQIIIDGVDIKDCKRRIGKDNYCRYYKRPCSENNYNCIWKKYLRKEQECQQAMDNYVQLDLQRVKEYNELVDLYKAKEQELKNICKAFDIEYAIDEETGSLIGRCNKLYKKEQECERLKEEVSLLKESNSKLQQIEDVNSLEKCYLHQLDQLKAENKELKKQRQADKGLITSTGKINYQLLQEYDKLKNCLTEIKEIAENVQSFVDWNLEDDVYTEMDKILQKISECEVENERKENCN